MSHILICISYDSHDFTKWIKYNLVYITGRCFPNTHAYCWDCYGYYYYFSYSWCTDGVWNQIISTFSYVNATIIYYNNVIYCCCCYHYFTNLRLLFHCCFWFINCVCTFSISCLNVNSNGWNSSTLIIYRTRVSKIFCSYIWSILYHSYGC